MQLTDRNQAWRVVWTQLVASLLIALVVLAFGTRHGVSALAGGTTAAFGNALFAVVVFGRYRAQQPGQLVARFYAAELAKLIIIALCFTAAILWLKSISILALLGAFMAVSLVPALVTYFFKH